MSAPAPPESDAASAAYARYDATTSRWGRLTMVAALLLSYAAPAYLLLGTGLDVPAADVLTGVLAVVAVFGVIALVEPVTYFPVLGPAAMYQAFMIGNIANKLLPAAIVAQAAIGARPGTRRAELAAVMAIGGAAAVHLVSLLVLVGLLGTTLLGLLPEALVASARLYIFPAIIGAVLVQLVAYVKDARTAVAALVVALVVQLGLVPVVPTAVANFATAVVVLVTMAAAWVLRDRRRDTAADRATDPTTPQEDA